VTNLNYVPFSKEGLSMYAYLRVVSGPDQGRIFNLVEGTTLSIGRGEKADTRLSDGAAARLHCELHCSEGEFRLVDRDSIGGTLVGGQRIEEHVLTHGEEFEIGNTRMKLFASGVADSKRLVEAHGSAFRPAIRPDEGVLTGQTVSHFELGPVLARGNSGTIYKARDTRAGKDVAVKVLYREIVHDEAALKRFITVIKAAAGLHHNNLIALLAAGKQGETCWFAMEYVEGESLMKIIERLATKKMISWKHALSLGVQIAQALEALHERHIVHGNVAPESILIRSKDKVAKLGDMMMARVANGAESNTTARPSELAGNVSYLSPEQTRGDANVDTRSDIYSLGATLYTLLAGRPPFEGKTLIETVAKIRQDDPIPPKRFQDAIPDELQDVVEKMLAKRPEQRYQVPLAAAQALSRVAKAQEPTPDSGKSALLRSPSTPTQPVR
jgi:serine/threonine protein kinase